MSRVQQKPASVGLLAMRIPFGLFMLLAGVGKISGGVGGFVEGASGMAPGWAPDFLITGYLYCVPFAEVLVGALLIAGLLTRSAGLASALMIFSFSVALVNAKGWDGGFVGHGPGPFSANAIYIGLCVLLALAGPGIYSIDHQFVIKRKKGS